MALPSERAVYGIYSTDAGQRIICRDILTEAEAKAYAEQPDTFFGVVKKQRPLTDPMELYDFFFSSYGKSDKEVLLRLMENRPDIESLRALPRRELAQIYCESLVYGVMEHSGSSGTGGGGDPQ